MWKCNKTAIWKSGRGTSLEPNHADILISDFPVSKLWGINYCCLNYPVYGIFVLAAQTKTERFPYATRISPLEFELQTVPENPQGWVGQLVLYNLVLQTPLSHPFTSGNFNLTIQETHNLWVSNHQDEGRRSDKYRTSDMAENSLLVCHFLIEEHFFLWWCIVLTKVPKLFLQIFQYEVATLKGSLNSQDRSDPYWMLLQIQECPHPKGWWRNIKMD